MKISGKGKIEQNEKENEEMDIVAAVRQRVNGDDACGCKMSAKYFMQGMKYQTFG